MRRIRPIGYFLFGFLLATLAGSLLRASPVMAQEAWSDLSISRAGATPAPASPKRRPVPLAEDDVAPRPPMVMSTSAEQRRLPENDPPRPGSRELPPIERDQADGETEKSVGVDAPSDGHIAVAELPAPADGQEPYVGDPRLPEDQAAFLTPPAGYDALAFQIELEPNADARPARLTALDPYAAVGHRAGSWVLFPTVESGATGVTNVYRTSNAKPDLIFDVRPTLLAVTDWQKHALQFKVTGLGSEYAHFSSENERSYAFEARGRIDISRRTNIEVLAAHSLDQEPRSSIFAPTDARMPTPYATDRLAMAFNQRFNHLSLQLRTSLTSIDYKPVSTIDGAILGNDERDLTTRDVAVRASWNFDPILAVFAESAFNSQTYRSTPADGIARDSTGDRFKVGLAFGNNAKIWRGEVATGYGRQIARDARMPDAEGLLLEANLGWKPSPLTSLLFKASTDFVTSTTVGQSAAVQHLAGIELRHAFQRRLIGIAGLSLQQTRYEAASLSERTTTTELGFEYFVDRSTTLLGRYQHTALESTDAATNSTSDSIHLGVRYRP